MDVKDMIAEAVEKTPAPPKPEPSRKKFEWTNHFVIEMTLPELLKLEFIGDSHQLFTLDQVVGIDVGLPHPRKAQVKEESVFSLEDKESRIVHFLYVDDKRVHYGPRINMRFVIRKTQETIRAERGSGKSAQISGKERARQRKQAKSARDKAIRSKMQQPKGSKSR